METMYSQTMFFFRAIISMMAASVVVLSCGNNSNKSKLNLSTVGAALSLPAYYDLTGQIDTNNTPNCGSASPYNGNTTSGGTGSGGTGGTGTTSSIQQTSGGSSGSSSSSSTPTAYSVVSQLVMKLTQDVLSLKFYYYPNQYQGPLNQQQGFVFAGNSVLGTFTITGNRGTVKYQSRALDINTSSSSTQTLAYMNISLNLTGSYVDGTGTNTNYNQCYTSDGVHCTSQTTNSQCFTNDNVNCVVLGNSSGSPVIITGNIDCNSNILPNGNGSSSGQ